MDADHQDQDGEHPSPQKSPSHLPNGHNDQNLSSSPDPLLQQVMDSQQDTAQANTSQPSQTNGNQPLDTQTPPSGPNTMPEEAAPIDPTEALEPFGWDDLEDRFVKKMEDCEKQEAAIEKEFAEWCRVFQAWASTTREYEEERLHKRLKTRMAWVQNSESTLEEKRQHYIKVVQAFESALALLGGL